VAELTPDIAGTEGPSLSGANSPSSAIGEFAIGLSPIGGSPQSSGSPGLTKIIPSYLYWQYKDDDNLQALISAYNQIAQEYLDWFNQIGLPDYTGPLIYGALLDWLAQGLYGILRPTLPSGTAQTLGPLGALGVGDGVPLGVLDIVGPSAYYVTNDDIFKRIITWHFYKGDGKVFNIQWLKRRIMRFLLGTNGVATNIDQTYRISVTFGTNNQVNIRIVDVISTFVGGAMPGILDPGYGSPLGTITAQNMPLPGIPYAQQLKDAINYGALELPFQYTYVVSI
jgi:hypothetical protein